MFRFALAVGLLAAATAPSQAGYLLIRVLLEGSGGGGPGGGTPGPVGAGGMPFPGGAGGMPFPGGGGGAFPGGGGGRPGGLGGDSLGGSGAGGAVPPGFGPPGGQSGRRSLSDPNRSIFVVVPYSEVRLDRPFYPQLGGEDERFNPKWSLAIKHPTGVTNLFVDNSTVQAYYDFGPGVPKGPKTRQSQLLARHQAWRAKPPDAQVLLDLVAEALQIGLVGKAVEFADELAAAVEDPKTARVTPPVQGFATAYKQLQRALKAPPTQRGNGPEWVARFNGGEFRGAKFVTQGHFTLIFWDASQEDQARRLAQLEDNLRAFYLLHALRGVALPVPEKPLTVVLGKTPADTVNLGRSLDHFPAVADGFYVPEYDLLVLAPDRLDEVGRTFTRQLQQMYREGVSRQALQNAGTRQVPVRLDTTGQTKGTQRPERAAQMMTFALVELYAGEATELQAVSREGCRQLLYATGQLPRHVALPQWLSGGAVGYYTRPRGPAVTTRVDDEKEKTIVTVAPTTGYGVPNFVRQKQFHDLVANKELNADPGTTLRNVVTDLYFTAVGDRVDADDPRFPRPQQAAKKGPPGGGGRPGDVLGPAPFDPAAVERRRLEFLRDKAYATAWALYYHLAATDPAGLARYTEELARMPRDLPLDEATRLDLFARAFNLTTGASRQGDRRTFAEFGAQWIRAMDGLPPSGVEIELTEPLPPEAAGPGTPGGMPGFPGGFPGGFGGAGGGNAGPGDGSP